jgi:hypothetical protein
MAFFWMAALSRRDVKGHLGTQRQLFSRTAEFLCAILSPLLD